MCPFLSFLGLSVLVCRFWFAFSIYNLYTDILAGEMRHAIFMSYFFFTSFTFSCSYDDGFFFVAHPGCLGIRFLFSSQRHTAMYELRVRVLE
jgi:hypothetical protein